MPSHQHHPRGGQRPAEGACAGFRRRRLLEPSDFATIEEIAEAENINPSYVSRLLRMTLLAPEIVEAILNGGQPEGLTTRGRCGRFQWNGGANHSDDFAGHSELLGRMINGLIWIHSALAQQTTEVAKRLARARLTSNAANDHIFAPPP
jgi:hypothetical protein